MSDPTTNFGWNIPNVDADEDTWGGIQNTLYQDIDDEVWAQLPRDGSRAMTGQLDLVASSTSAASLSIPAGTAPTAPANGDFWATSSALFGRFGGATKQFAFTDSDSTGNAATATKWATARTLTVDGDVSGSVIIDGSENETLTLEIGAGKVGNTELADMPANTVKGDNGSGVADLTMTQLAAMLDLAQINSATQSLANAGYIEIGGIKLQWGRYTGGSSSPTVTFSSAFSSTPWVVVPVALGDEAGSGNGGVNVVQLNTRSAASFTAWCSRENGGNDVLQADTGVSFDWIAVGPA